MGKGTRYVLWSFIIKELYLYGCRYDHFCGDINARLGTANDCIDDLDNIPKRSGIDYTKNKHGESFIEFLNQSCMCILNGRFTPLNDGFTSLSSKGAAVVDYIAGCKLM